MNEQAQKKGWRGDAILTETTDAGACLVSVPMIPRKRAHGNRFSPALSRLLDQATERQEWHAERATECARDIRFYQAALSWHREQAHRAQRIRAALERLVSDD